MEIGACRTNKMRASLVFCVAAIFHTAFVTSRDDEDHEIQNSMTTRDIKGKANYTQLSADLISMTPVSSDEENDYKCCRGRVYPSRIKRRTTHRPRTKSRNSTRDDKKADHDRNDDADGTAQIDINEFLNDPFHEGLESLLARLVDALENNSRENDKATSNSSTIDDDAGGFDDEDRCQKWLDNREKIERAFPGSVANLPACPCQYPNNIFYNNQIWDKKRERKFRWRDVSHDKDRLTIYKPGAVYCVQTLPSQENESAVVQHCCYDNNRKLLTRGSGAGTPYIVSPDVSPLLHDKIDLLPWRLCKGDFTRYNEVRIPNNDNNCKINPNNEEYQHQVERAKDY